MAYVDLTTRFTYKLQTVFGDFSKLANNDKWINENGWQDGTMGVFFQPAAPVGWTKQIVQNGKGLRIVSGSGGGTGGSADPSAVISLAHTNSIASQADHTHVLTDHTAYLAIAGGSKANGAAVLPIIELSQTQSGIPAKTIMDRTLGGAVQHYTKLNQLAMINGPYTTGSGGAHDHGGLTASALTDITLKYMDVLICSKDTSSGYTDLSLTFVHNTRNVTDYLIECGLNDAFNYARRTPAGSISIFGTPASPVGWTKINAQDGCALRVTSGTGGGTGGSFDGRTVIRLAHDHGSLTSDGAHTHTMPAHQHKLADNSLITANGSAFAVDNGGVLREQATAAGSGTGQSAETASDGSGTSSSNGAHQHATGTALSDITLAYVHGIQASKDSTGAASSYTDMSAFFVPVTNDPSNAPLLAYQDLQTMAANDDYLHFHVMPTGGIMFFFQAAAPLNWTKQTVINDRLLIMTSGSDGGATGGSASISGGITLAHGHSLDSKSHTHTLAHTHSLGTTATTINAPGTVAASTRIFGPHGAEMYRDQQGGAGDDSLGPTTESVTVTTDSFAHTHGGVTGSSLSNVTLAYADVIMCTKN